MSGDSNYTIADAKQLMAKFVKERNFEEFHSPAALAAAISVEASELLEVFQWLSPEQVKAMMSDIDFRTRMADEMADVFLYLCSLSIQTGIDLSQAITLKMKKNEIKYPVPSQCQ